MKRIVLLCGCLLVWGSAGAQLTLDSCRLLARNHYPEIRRYDLVRQTEEYTLSNARREGPAGSTRRSCRFRRRPRGRPPCPRSPMR